MSRKRNHKITNKVIKKVARWVEGGYAWSYPLLYGQWTRTVTLPVARWLNKGNIDSALGTALNVGMGGFGAGVLQGMSAMQPRRVPSTYTEWYEPIKVLPTHGWHGLLSSGLANLLFYGPLLATSGRPLREMAVPLALGAAETAVPGILHYFTGPWLRKANDHFNYWESGAKSDKRYVETVLNTLRFADTYDEMARELSKLRDIYDKNIHNWEALFRTFDQKYPNLVEKALPHLVRVSRGINGVIEPVGMFAHNAARLRELPSDMDPLAYLVGSTLAGMVVGAVTPTPELEEVLLSTTGYAVRSDKAPKSLEEIKKRYRAIREKSGVSETSLAILDKRMERVFEAAEALRKVDLYKSSYVRDGVELIFRQIQPALRRLAEDSYRDFLEGVQGVRRVATEIGVK